MAPTKRPALSNITNARGSALPSDPKKRRLETSMSDTSTSTSTSRTSTSTSRLQRGTASSSARRDPPATSSATRAAPTPASSAAARRAAASTSSRAPQPAESEDAKKRKRDPWDLRGRLQDLEAFTTQLKEQVKASDSKVFNLSAQLAERETALTQVSTTKTVLEQDLTTRQTEMDDLLRGNRELRQTIESQRLAHQTEVDEMQRRYQSLSMTQENTLIKLQVSQEEIHRLQTLAHKQTLTIETLNAEILDWKAKKEELERIISDLNKVIEDFKCSDKEQKDTIAELKQQRREHEMLRRKLHNHIQELKGNIRVFCRVRPLIGDEKNDSENSVSPYLFPANCDNQSIEVQQGGRESVSGSKHSGKTTTFSFDKVFGPSVTQAEVFDEISQLVQSALDGYNACIFTYGQTGSGKTFTMEGPGRGMAELGLEGENKKLRGMIPRAVEQIFKSAKALEEQGWEYTMEALFLEIYKEKIRDLLSTQPRTKDSKKSIEYEIKHDNKGNTTVTNLTVARVEAPYQVYDLLKRAAHNRSVGTTKINERSSRSHSVFQLKLTGVNKVTGASAVGVLNLIDLAGSERVDVSGATGDRLEETKHINRSLTLLGNVIYSLAQRNKSHVPYRDSKLTYLLQNYLGGNSKVLMFVNVSPLPRDVNESINSLRFATKVNSCDIGTAKRNLK